MSKKFQFQISTLSQGLILVLGSKSCRPPPFFNIFGQNMKNQLIMYHSPLSFISLQLNKTSQNQCKTKLGKHRLDLSIMNMYVLESSTLIVQFSKWNSFKIWKNNSPKITQVVHNKLIFHVLAKNVEKRWRPAGF